MSYYYLVSSLPPLALDEKPPTASGQFLRDVEHLLSPDDLQEVRTLVDRRDSACRHPLIRWWCARETQVRNAVARHRAARSHSDADAFLRTHEGYDVASEKAVAEAFAAETPLEKERRLDALRWQLAEELALQDAFGIGAVFAFVLKLRIAERWQAMTDEKGREVFLSVVKQNKTI